MQGTAVERFNVFRSYYDAAMMLDDECRLALYDAIFAFGFDGVVPEFADKALQLAWTLVEPNLRKSIKNVLDGMSGGRPKKKIDNPPFNPPFEPSRKAEGEKEAERETDGEEAKASAHGEGKEYGAFTPPSFYEVLGFVQEWDLGFVADVFDLEGWFDSALDCGWSDKNGRNMAAGVKFKGLIMPRWQSILIGIEEGCRIKAGLIGDEVTVTPPTN